MTYKSFGNIQVLSKQKLDSCKSEITEKKLLKSVKTVINVKSQGNDGLSKEFHETF